jgi:hypothetical protein
MVFKKNVICSTRQTFAPKRIHDIKERYMLNSLSLKRFLTYFASVNNWGHKRFGKVSANTPHAKNVINNFYEEEIASTVLSTGQEKIPAVGWLLWCDAGGNFY